MSALSRVQWHRHQRRTTHEFQDRRTSSENRLNVSAEKNAPMVLQLMDECASRTAAEHRCFPKIERWIEPFAMRTAPTFFNRTKKWMAAGHTGRLLNETELTGTPRAEMFERRSLRQGGAIHTTSRKSEFNQIVDRSPQDRAHQ
jgi:hypothetical protein